MKWAIERDDFGVPRRLVWLGAEYRATPIIYTACPRCHSKHVLQNTCLNCWWKDTGGH